MTGTRRYDRLKRGDITTTTRDRLKDVEICERWWGNSRRANTNIPRKSHANSGSTTSHMLHKQYRRHISEHRRGFEEMIPWTARRIIAANRTARRIKVWAHKTAQIQIQIRHPRDNAYLIYITAIRRTGHRFLYGQRTLEFKWERGSKLESLEIVKIKGMKWRLVTMRNMIYNVQNYACQRCIQDEESLSRHAIRDTIHRPLWDNIGRRRWHPTKNQEPERGDD